MRHSPELRNPEDYKQGWKNYADAFNAPDTIHHHGDL